MQAIILAAGMGKRLKELTAGNTKCMVEVNGVTLIERALRILDKKGLSRIVIVVGYEGQKLMEYIETLSVRTPICYINNSIYNKTNNIYSLSLAKEYLISEDSLLLESDLIFEEEIIDMLLEDERQTLALVDKFESWMDGTCMVLDSEDCITDFIPGKYLKFDAKEDYYKTVNIYKFSKHFSANTYVPFLEAYSKAMGDNEYYESVIKLIALLETKEIRARRLEGQVWYEIDDIQDLDIAESLFADNVEEKYDAIAKRYGGYWRYPKILDFCYLVNPYYPSEKMKEELKSNFDTLLTQYPSGMAVNSLLAGKHFGMNPQNIVIGNGAAELINELMKTIKGRVGFIRPTFEEYPNRIPTEMRVCMNVAAKDFRYSVKDITQFFEKEMIEALVLINPDNPSGNYIENQELRQLIEWCRKKEIKLIIDESFVDFVHNEGNPEEITLITKEWLESYEEGLFVVKSISKSHGVPGVRLGVMASGNREILKEIKQNLSIWNINSFGEFYMQIADKYKKDYAAALQKLQSSRETMMRELRKVSFLTVFPSEANYIMCEVEQGISSRELTCYLLQNNILIKDLTGKLNNGKQYIRIAVRKEEENQYLIEKLKAFQKN